MFGCCGSWWQNVTLAAVHTQMNLWRWPHTWDELVSHGAIPHRHQQQLENLNSNVLALTTEHVLIWSRSPVSSAAHLCPQMSKWTQFNNISLLPWWWTQQCRINGWTLILEVFRGPNFNGSVTQNTAAGQFQTHRGCSRSMIYISRNAWELGFFIYFKQISLSKVGAGRNLGICVSKLPSLNVS